MAFNSLIDKRDRTKRQERTYLKAETNDTHDDLGDDLESVVRFDVVFEDVRQSYRVADIVLKSFHAVNAEDKPQFQWTETSTQWDLPMLQRNQGCFRQDISVRDAEAMRMQNLTL